MTEFRRLVLELGHGTVDPAMLRQAAEFARLLDAGLHALFVEDETVLHASALPFTREISPLSLRWRPLETGQLEAELHVAAERARAHLLAAAARTGVTPTFEVRRGDVATYVTQTCVASDIVVVATRREATHGALRLRETARQSPAAVLFLPPRPKVTAGPIVALVGGADDPAQMLAERIAGETRSPVTVVTAAGKQVPDIVAALGETRERMIIMTRDGLGDGLDLAAVRGVPVLVLEPA